MIENTTSVTYLGLKGAIPGIYSACLDCDDDDNGQQALFSYNNTSFQGNLNLTVRNQFPSLPMER
jgi:hypothetical protein